MMIPLSVLDQSPIAEGSTPAQAIANTLALAQLAEACGYARYWLAEHHNTAAFAGSAPEILTARVASVTARIRVGPGGVMLPHYSPLKVAEQFRMLETLFPGRIDLGFGRAPGADPKTSAALQAGPKAWPVEVFPQQVELVEAFLRDAAGEAVFPDGHAYRGIHAMPRGEGMPELWMLGSSLSGAAYAAELGLPYCHAHFINPDTAEAAIAAYRARFRPGLRDRPHVAAAVSALAADSDAEAERLSASRHLWVVQLLQNKAGRFPSTETALAHPYTEQERVLLRAVQARSIAGATDDVCARLRKLAGALALDELVILTITEEEARRRSYALLAEAWGLRGS